MSMKNFHGQPPSPPPHVTCIQKSIVKHKTHLLPTAKFGRSSLKPNFSPLSRSCRTDVLHRRVVCPGDSSPRSRPGRLEGVDALPTPARERQCRRCLHSRRHHRASRRVALGTMTAERPKQLAPWYLLDTQDTGTHLHTHSLIEMEISQK